MRFDFNKRSNSIVQAAINPVHVAAPHERVIAVIGTAGRDKTKPMSAELWAAMCEDLKQRVGPDDHLVSGGAAWADHLAVHAYLQEWVKSITLYLPAPAGEKAFVGPRGSAASAANYYHERFSQIIGRNTYDEILEIIKRSHTNSNVRIESEPAAPGYGAMFARNKKVAALANAVIAYTFGEGDEPADGGTMNTWKQIATNDKTHVPLGALLETRKPLARPPRLSQPLKRP